MMRLRALLLLAALLVELGEAKRVARNFMAEAGSTDAGQGPMKEKKGSAPHQGTIAAGAPTKNEIGLDAAENGSSLGAAEDGSNGSFSSAAENESRLVVAHPMGTESSALPAEPEPRPASGPEVLLGLFEIDEVHSVSSLESAVETAMGDVTVDEEVWQMPRFVVTDANGIDITNLVVNSSNLELGWNRPTIHGKRLSASRPTLGALCGALCARFI